jgi:hypothetical protein
LGLEEEVKSARTILFGDENLENFSAQYTTIDLEILDEIM